jgi:hypothetical protein
MTNRAASIDVNMSSNADCRANSNQSVHGASFAKPCGGGNGRGSMNERRTRSETTVIETVPRFKSNGWRERT